MVLSSSTNAGEMSAGVFRLSVAFCCIGMVISLASILFTVKNRKHRVVRASQVSYLVLAEIGTLITALTLGFQLIRARWACMATIVSFSFGFVMTFSALVSKQYRIWAIFFKKGRRTKRLSRLEESEINLRMRACTIGFIVVDVAVLLLWFLIDPLHLSSNPEQDALFGFCKTDNPEIAQVFIGMLFLFKIFILVLGNWFAFLCRNVNAVFSESTSIAIVMYSILIIYTLGGTTMKVVCSSIDVGTVLRGMIAFLPNFSVQLFIFGSKIIFFRYGASNAGIGSEYIHPPSSGSKIISRLRRKSKVFHHQLVRRMTSDNLTIVSDASSMSNVNPGSSASEVIPSSILSTSPQ